MELKFLGKGGSDNQLQGNTSAYFIENRCLFLIDCGENIFERILRKQLLNDVDKVFIFITHTFRSCWKFRKLNFSLLFFKENRIKHRSFFKSIALQ